MRVLFLYTSTNMCRDGKLWYYDEAAAVVAACLRRAGHTVDFRTVNHDDTCEAVAEWVAARAAEKTLLVFMTSLMFSSFGHDLPDTFRRVARLNDRFRFPVAFVGVHATLNPEETIARDGVDYVGRGEMEEALVELCGALEAGRPVRHVRNFWVKENGVVHRNPVRPLVADLDRLPFGARDLLPSSRMANERDGILTVVASRGCPMRCNFCSNHVLHKLYPDDRGYFRIKSVGFYLREIRAALDAGPDTRAIFFQEDVFGLDPRWTREFLARYSEEIGLPWGCNLLMRQVTPPFADQLRKAGCRQVHIGIESGSPHLRNEVLNKGIREDEIHPAVEALREAGISISVYAMIGLPHETRCRLAESVRNLARYRADMIQVQIWQPLAGSELLMQGDPAPLADSGARRGRDAWRLGFFFRHFHRLVAVYGALEARRDRHPWLARLTTWLVSLAIRFPWTPELLLAHDGDGRRRFAAHWMENPGLRRLVRNRGGRFWREVLQRELRLASLYLWPADVGEAPTGRGWIRGGRVDLREYPDPDARTEEPAERAHGRSAATL
jgi:radical SAM superfamily enzyme YgiQ (UPF0313 family)